MKPNWRICGRPCDAIRKGYRKRSVGRHVIFYRTVNGGVDVVRILHEQMDVDRHLLHLRLD